ncbi:hypothetical protein E2I00_005120, partial [Balaenoptera physalus]
YGDRVAVAECVQLETAGPAVPFGLQQRLVRCGLHDECEVSCYRNLPLNHVSLPGSFLVGDNGRVYEDVGWNIQGMHAQGYNNVSLGLTFFGNKLACPNIITRSAWKARQAHCPTMNLPAKYVIIIHTIGATCNISMDCLICVRDIESYHMDTQNFCDIGYQ